MLSHRIIHPSQKERDEQVNSWQVGQQRNASSTTHVINIVEKEHINEIDLIIDYFMIRLHAYFTINATLYI